MSSLKTDHKPFVWAVVPAAGIGARMAAGTPKQYLSIIEKTVIEHSLERLLQITEIGVIVVALHPQDSEFRQLAVARQPKIHCIIGGRERSDSVLAALNSLEDRAAHSDWVLTHDAARCCVQTSSIDRLLETIKNDPVGGILAVPCSDTLKHINSEEKIIKTLDRQTIWQAQTPQMFRYGMLKTALEQAQHHKHAVTDEASAVELAGYQPRVVMGHYDNVKITHPGDIAIATAILEQQLHSKQACCQQSSYGEAKP